MKHIKKKIGAILLVIVFVITMQPAAIPAKTHTLGNTVANQILGSGTCEYGGRIYFACSDTIYSVKKDGTGKKTVYTVPNAQWPYGVIKFIVHDGYIYAICDFTNGDHQLIRVKLDGTEYKKYGNAENIALADGKLYYTKGKVHVDEEDGLWDIEYTGIYVMDLDGSNSKALVKKSGVYMIATDGDAIYYKSYGAGKNDIYCCDMKGKNKKKIISYENLSGFTISGNYCYYGEEKPGLSADGKVAFSTVIYRKNMKNNSVKTICTYKGGITNFFVSGKNIYASSYQNGLVRINIETGKSKVLNKDADAGIRGVHGSVLIFDQFRNDPVNHTTVDMILVKVSNGKKIKKIGAYFVS